MKVSVFLVQGERPGHVKMRLRLSIGIVIVISLQSLD